MVTSSSLGFYIVGEGHDGVGKSTQIELLSEYFQKEFDIETYVMHEPDGCAISGEIRTIIKNGTLERDAITNLLLFTASRHETWFREAMPVLQRGGIVLSARNYMSSEVYQGLAEGLGVEYVRQVTAAFMNERYMNPDITVVFHLGDDARKARIDKRKKAERPDTFESRDDDFIRKVQEGYAELAAQRAYRMISTEGTVSSVQKQFRTIVFQGLVKKGLR